MWLIRHLIRHFQSRSLTYIRFLSMITYLCIHTCLYKISQYDYILMHKKGVGLLVNLSSALDGLRKESKRGRSLRSALRHFQSSNRFLNRAFPGFCAYPRFSSFVPLLQFFATAHSCIFMKSRPATINSPCSCLTFVHYCV